MKRLLVLFVVLFILVFSYTVIAQEMGLLRKNQEINFPVKLMKTNGPVLPAGTYTIGSGGYFPTIDSAFKKLSSDGIAGEVTLELIDELYIAPTTQYGFFLNGPIPGSSSRVIIKPAVNKNVTIEGNGRAAVTFFNTNYVTVDGVGLTGATTLTIHTLKNSTYTYNDGIDFINNSDHNVMQNIIFIDEDTDMGGSGCYSLLNSSTAPDSNLIQNNFIKKGGWTLYVSAVNTNLRAMGNIIRGNKVGSATDSLISWGIYLEKCQNTVVENNIVQNLKINGTSFPSTIGIYSYFGSGDIIRNNIIHNLKANAGYTSTGILLSGSTGETGLNNQVYNNMVYDIKSTSTASDSRVTGIQILYQNNPKIYYNSVYLSGTGTNKYGSAALYIEAHCTGVDVKNNVLVNTRNESPYTATSIYLLSGFSTFSSNFNDLYNTPNQYNCLAKIGSTKYNTLADWQATGKDIYSITEMPNFIAPNLHIDLAIPTGIESGATPIAGITSDFDGDLRNSSTPDIGADEFSGTVPVELTTFTAVANGKEITLNWSTATEINNLGFEVQRKFNDGEFTVIGSIKGQGTTTNPKQYSFVDKNLIDGKYSYRLKQIDFNGTYEYSNIVEVDWKAFNSYLLEQNYPNPFNPTTKIGYGIKEKSNVKITILNAIGEEVAVLLNAEKEAGYHQIEFNASDLPSGVYFYQLQAGNYLNTKKMILLK